MTRYTWRLLAAGIGVALAVAGCAGSGSGTAQQQDVNCVQGLTPDQVAQYGNQLAANGQQAMVEANNDGTSDVCVVENVGGTYETHWYNRSDGDNFLRYLELMYLARSVGGYHSGNALLMYGVVDGSISPLEAFALSSLMDVRSDGVAYPLYYRNNGGYVYRTTPPSSSYHVTRCQYGRHAATRWTSTTLTSAQSGYPHPKALSASDEEAQFSHGRVRVSTLSANNKFGYHFHNPSLPTPTARATRPAPTRSRVTVPTVNTPAPRKTKFCISTKKHPC